MILIVLLFLVMAAILNYQPDCCIVVLRPR